MNITKNNWRNLYNEATDCTTKHAIAWIGEHEEWGEYDERGINEAAKKSDQYMWDMTHDENGNFKLWSGGSFHA